MPSQAIQSALPVRFGSDEQFALVRDFLRAAGFTAEAVRSRVPTGLPTVELARTASFGLDPANAADLLVWLFVLGRTSPVEHLQRLIPAPAIAAMEALGLLARDGDDAVFGNVFLAPAAGVFCAVDRWFERDGAPLTMAADVVYPASTPTTLRFLNLLPQTACRQLLDLGTGSGIIALAASSYATSGFATDITERSCFYAEFNRRLNDIPDVTVAQGDLYEPVANQVFDRIIAHPPYVPMLKSNWTFSDGGEDGERLTRRIVEGLPQHLAPGGLFLCDATGSDREERFEFRVREWLRASAAEFDVAVFVRRQYAPAQFAEMQAARYPESGAAADWIATFDRLRIGSVLQMTLVLQRAATARPAFTVRHKWGIRESSELLQWTLAWEAFALTEDAFEFILREKPVVSPSLALQITHRPGDHGFVPVHFRMETDYPFTTESEIEPWMASLLNLCNGEASTAELFATVLGNGDIPADTPVEKFAALICTFVSQGFLRLAGFRFPAPE